MKARLALALLAAAAAVVPAACGDEPSSSGPAHVESTAPHARPTPEQATSGAAIVRNVGAQLYDPLAKAAGTGNVAYSPLSIATALGMTRAGAQGDSADQLDAFFNVDAGDDVHGLINGADETVRGLDGPVKISDREELGEVRIETANALWGQSDTTFEQPFLDLLRSGYDASMWTADYKRDPEGARAAINDWVKGHTGEKITELLPKDSVDDLTRLVLVNALWFKAPWPEKLEDLPAQRFTTAAGTQVQARMLKAESVTYRSDDDWEAVTIPYAGNKLGMTLLVPRKGKLADVEDGLDADLLRRATTGGEPHSASVTFPRFDLDVRAELKPALQSVGVTAPFRPSKDFLPISRDADAQDLHLKDVLHQATVTVDEFGTEAAAATGAIFNTVGGFIGGHELVVDRPFLFVIHDLDTSTPLFVGRVGDPTTH